MESENESRYFDNKNRIEIGLIALFILIHFVYFWGFHLYDFFSLSLFEHRDTYSYLLATKKILLGYPDLSRPVMYPLTLVPPYLLFQTGYYFFAAVAIIQFLMLGIVWRQTFRLLCREIPVLFAAIATGIFMLNISFTVMSSLVLTEISFMLFLTCCATFLVKYLREKKAYLLFLTVLCLSIATLTRPGLWPCTVLISLILATHTFLYNRNLFTLLSIPSALLPILCFILWVGNSYGVNRLSVIGELALYKYLNTRTVSMLYPEHTLEQWMQKRDNLLELNLNESNLKNKLKKQQYLIKKDTDSLLRYHWPVYIKAYLYNLWSNTHSGSTLLRYELDHPSVSVGMKRLAYDSSRIYNMVSVILLMVCNSYIFVCILRRKKIASLSVIIIFLLCNYLFFSAGISFYQGDRFHIVWMPLLCIGMALLHNHTKSIRE